MKQLIFTLCTMLIVQFYATAQSVGISTNAATPDGSSMLDISSTSKGFLIPRMTLAQRNAISSPANGLLVFQLDGIPGIYYFFGGTWYVISSALAATLPAVTTSTITGITNSTGTGGGNVTNDGGTPVTARGICWSTSINPTISNSRTNDGTGTGAFISNLTGLTASTAYHVRAYATNSVGTAYGNEVIFSTSSPTVPVVITTAILSTTNTTAIEGGNVTSDGGASVTARGICWSTSANPTTANSHTSDGTGTGSFKGNLTGLVPATTYHFRAYATNSVNTAYGSDLTFTTGLAGALPSVNIIGYSLLPPYIHCQVSSEGSFPVTERGVCWSLNPDPTIDLPTTMTDTGSGPGYYDLEIGSLPYYTTFYFRAYAKSNAGIIYSNNYALMLEY